MLLKIVYLRLLVGNVEIQTVQWEKWHQPIEKCVDNKSDVRMH
jgi:hypothetical protein